MIQEPIFKEEEKSVIEASASMMSFKDCPNKCVDGYYIDPYKHKKIKCQYCADKRKKIVQGKLQASGDNGVEDIRQLLNLPRSFVGLGNYDINTVIPVASQKLLEQDSITLVDNELKSLISSASLGEVSEESLFFNLGSSSILPNFINTYLTRAYMSGLTVCPLISERDVMLARLSENPSVELNKNIKINVDFSTMLEKEVCVVFISTGASREGIESVLGLIQLRAQYDRSTIVFTKHWGYTIKIFSWLFETTDIKDKSIPRNISVKYKPRYENNSNEKDSESSYSTRDSSQVVNNNSQTENANKAGGTSFKSLETVRSLDSDVGMSQKSFNDLFSYNTSL